MRLLLLTVCLLSVVPVSSAERRPPEASSFKPISRAAMH